jgi:hypothetical protein
MLTYADVCWYLRITETRIVCTPCGGKSIWHWFRSACCACFLSIRQLTSAYVSIRGQVYLALVPQRMLCLLPPYTSAYVSIRGQVYLALVPQSMLRLLPPHTSAYVSIRQHTSAYGGRSIWHWFRSACCACCLMTTCLQHTSAYVSIRQHTSAYVSIRQHLLAHDNLPDLRLWLVSVAFVLHTSAYVSIRQRMLMTTCQSCNSCLSALLSSCIRQHTSAYVSICQHTSASLSSCDV